MRTVQPVHCPRCGSTEVRTYLNGASRFDICRNEWMAHLVYRPSSGPAASPRRPSSAARLERSASGPCSYPDQIITPAQAEELVAWFQM